MIDLHAHVLPGIDDGPPDMEQSLALLRVAALAGTRVIAATPHLRRDFPNVRVEDIASACARLQEQVPQDWDLRIVSGGEVDLGWSMQASDEQLRMASYAGAGTDMLVETPYGTPPELFEPPLMRLMDRGYRVLLAHPELNPGLQRSSERLDALIARGVLVQITGASLLPDPRRSRRSRLARRLLERGQVHVIASDAHSGSWRPPGLRDAIEMVGRISPRRADWMVSAVPAAILGGEPLPALPR